MHEGEVVLKICFLPDAETVTAAFHVPHAEFPGIFGIAVQEFVAGSAADVSLGTCAAEEPGLEGEGQLLPESPAVTQINLFIPLLFIFSLRNVFNKHIDWILLISNLILKYCDNIFVKRTMPRVCFAHKGKTL